MGDVTGGKKKMGTGAKVAIGCGSGCLLIVILMIVAGVAGGLYVKKLISGYEEELKGAGFEKVIQGQMVSVTEPVTEPTLYKAQLVEIKADCSTNMAVLAQACDLYSTVEGRLYFRGQVLTIQPGAEVRGGVDATAQVVLNNGSVLGGVDGECQVIQQQSQ